MNCSMCIQNYDILQNVISYLDSMDLLNIESLSKLWLRCSKDQYTYLGESSSYRYLTYKKCLFQSFKDIVHRIYCYREKYQESNEFLISTKKNDLYSCLGTFEPGFIIFGNSFGFNCDTCFLKVYKERRILHTNRNINSFPENIGSVAGILDPVTRDIVSIGGWNEVTQLALSNVYHLNTSRFDWVEKTSLHYPTCYSATQSTSQGDIIVIGGGSSPYQGAEVFNKCSIRKSSEQSSEEYIWYDDVIPVMNSVRCGHSAIRTFDNSIVVVGGYSGGRNYLSSVEMLDQNFNQWLTLPSMQSPRSGMASVLSSNGSIYIAGGSIDGSIGLKSVERYDVREGKWQSMANMNLPRGYLSGDISCTEEFIVCGGLHNSVNQRGLERYDFKMNKWDFIDSDLSQNEMNYFQRACHQMIYVW